MEGTVLWADQSQYSTPLDAAAEGWVSAVNRACKIPGGSGLVWMLGQESFLSHGDGEL